MEGFMDYLKRYKSIAGVVAIALIMVMLGLFYYRRDNAPVSVDPYNAMRYQQFARCPARGPYPQMQPVALQSNTLTLPIGVTLAGRGSVISLEPGSPAACAGIQAGDIINRINGK